MVERLDALEEYNLVGADLHICQRVLDQSSDPEGWVQVEDDTPAVTPAFRFNPIFEHEEPDEAPEHDVSLMTFTVEEPTPPPEEEAAVWDIDAPGFDKLLASRVPEEMDAASLLRELRRAGVAEKDAATALSVSSEMSNDAPAALPPTPIVAVRVSD